VNAEPEVALILQRHLFANHLSQCDLPRWERKVAGTGHDLFLPTGKEKPPLMAVRTLDKALMRSPLVRNVILRFSDLVEVTDREQARQVAIELCLCVELFRRKYGEYPETIQKLVPEFLDKLPRDLFGSGPTERMLMTRRDIEEPVADDEEEVALVTRPWLIIYSRGLNGGDDGGIVVTLDDIGIRIPLEPAESSP
jgi:hypothetical protein